MSKSHKKRRILFVCNACWFFSSHRLPIAVEAIERGYDVFLLARGDSTKKEIENHGIKVIDWNLSRTSLKPMEEVKSIFEVLRVYRDICPSLVHLISPKAIVYGGIVAKAVDIPALIVAISGQGIAVSNQSRVARMSKHVIHYAYKYIMKHNNKRVIVQNRRDRDLMLDVYKLHEKEVMLTTGSGVNLKRFVPRKRSIKVKKMQ